MLTQERPTAQPPATGPYGGRTAPHITYIGDNPVQGYRAARRVLALWCTVLAVAAATAPFVLTGTAAWVAAGVGALWAVARTASAAAEVYYLRGHLPGGTG